MKILALAGSLICLLSACSTTTTTVVNDTEAVDLLERLRSSYATTPMLAIEGTMKISGMPVTIWFDALARNRDSLMIGLTGPFSMPVGALGATPDYFIFFNAQEGAAYEGRPDRSTFAKLMSIDMDYQQMISMIRGEIPNLPATGEYVAERRDDLVYYRVSRAGVNEDFTIDPETLMALDYRRWRESGSRQVTDLSIRFRERLRVGGRSVPRKAFVEINDNEQSISIEVDKASDNISEDRSLIVELPPGTPRKRI